MSVCVCVRDRKTERARVCVTVETRRSTFVQVRLIRVGRFRGWARKRGRAINGCQGNVHKHNRHT